MAFCLLFLPYISAQLSVPLLKTQLISICMSYKKKKSLKYHLFCFFLLSKTHHKFSSRHVRASILYIKFSMETHTSVIYNATSLLLGCLCVSQEGEGWEGKCDRQTNGLRLFGTCVSWASAMSWHVYISNHSQTAVGANRHLQLFVWPPPHK